MIKLTEFYNERQGRPASDVTMDMEKRQAVVVSTGGAITLDSLDSIIFSYGGEIVTKDGSILYRS